MNNGSQRFHFTCSLTCFVTTANDLSRTLAPFVADPYRFLEELQSACDGGIKCTSESTPSQVTKKRPQGNLCTNLSYALGVRTCYVHLYHYALYLQKESLLNKAVRRGRYLGQWTSPMAYKMKYLKNILVNTMANHDNIVVNLKSLL